MNVARIKSKLCFQEITNYGGNFYCSRILYYPNSFRTISRRLVEKLDVGIWEIASKAKGNGRSSLVIFIKLTLCPIIYITFPSNFMVLVSVSVSLYSLSFLGEKRKGKKDQHIAETYSEVLQKGRKYPAPSPP